VTTAFVLSGGGSLGAVQVGMLHALARREVRPDLLVGTSAGALNAAYLAGHGTTTSAVRGLERIWLGLRRRDVFPLQPVRAAAGLLGAATSLCSDAALRQLVTRYLPFDRLEEATIPLHVVTTDVLSGEEVLLSSGNAVDAVVASAAIPAVFPEVDIDGRYLVDGGIADNAAISQAVDLGADRIYVLPGGYTCALDRPPTSPLAVALQALTLLIEQRLIQEAARYATEVDLRVLPPLCPLHTASTDFSQAAELIERAWRATDRWLDEGGDTLPRPERFLSLHRHTGRPRHPAEN
jgi:NTE family protein